MTFVLVALGAGVAVAVELVEALAIVLAVAVSRRWSDALIGAAAAVVACALIAVVLGPVLLESVPLDALRVVIGFLLLLFGLEWLRKGTLRLAGRRARSSSVGRVRGDAGGARGRPAPAARSGRLAGPDRRLQGRAARGRRGRDHRLRRWPRGRAGRHQRSSGRRVACVAVVGAGAWVRKPLARVPETELKWGVGVLLSSFGVFFLAEGLHVEWPGGDAAVLYLVAVLAAVSQLQIHRLARA